VTAAVAKRARDDRAVTVERLRAEAAEAKAALTGRQRAFVEAYLEHGEARHAAAAAGYRHPTGATKIRNHARVKRAVVAALALREAELAYSRDDAVATLVAAARLRLEDVFEASPADGAPARVKDLAALPTGAQARIKRLTRDASGNVVLELVPITTVIETLARVAGWTPDSRAFPGVSVNLNIGVPDPAEAEARAARARAELTAALARARGGDVIDAEVIE
jgi:hypothetical protein